ncbi:PAS domain S-box protein [Nocardioides sp. HDW12B]|uniref:sensor histidine kinase n=1 Tax=Nocardioides sp. HDW12B TaxID=2714939 RepID=UPI00140A50FE|nr:ATP-binding protein [Nocardioides sp. HDW12B]QIK66658.1 PAS domain S-box protein [Nocardioides sp. HDW12B]
MSEDPSGPPSTGPSGRGTIDVRRHLSARLRHGRALQYVVVALVVAYTIWTVPGVRPAPGFEPWFDGLLQGSSYTLIAALAVLWVLRPPSSIPAASSIAVALVLRALGFALTLSFVSLGDPLPFPSVADLAWVGSSLLLILAVVLRVRDLAPRLPMLVVLDALGASLLLLGAVILLLRGPVRTLTEQPGVAADSVAFNLVYPVVDLALLMAVASLVAAGRHRLTGSDWLAIAGIVGYVVVDVAYFVLLAAGQWRPGNLLVAVSVVSTLVLALAVAAAPGRRRDPGRLIGELPPPTPAPGVAVPATMVGLAVVGLSLVSVTHSAGETHSTAATLAFVAAAAVAVTRGIRTVGNDRVAARSVLGIATTDLRRFQALVEASTDLIGMSDSEGNIVYLNPNGRRLLGMEDDRDVQTLTVATVAPGVGEAGFAKRWPVLLQTGFWEGQSELVPVDGSPPIPVAISTFVMRDPDTGEPFGLATIQRDIREMRRQEAALRDIADQRARLLNRLVQAQEAERAQIAADVHDDSVQALAVVDLRMGVLRRRAARSAPELVETVDDVQKAVSAATDRLRHLLFDLESPAEELGLRAALASAAEVVFTDTDVDWQVLGVDDLQLGDAERITAYRVAREAMVNARKHADPEHVTVALEREVGALVVTVSDDGRGFVAGSTDDRRGHLGLAAMHDRASVAGGELSITTPETGGTVVRLSLPVPG